jgi:hypothetical protein
MNCTLIVGAASGLSLVLARKVACEGWSELSSFPIHLNGYRSKNPSSELLLSQMGDDQARS